MIEALLISGLLLVQLISLWMIMLTSTTGINLFILLLGHLSLSLSNALLSRESGISVAWLQGGMEYSSPVLWMSSWFGLVWFQLKKRFSSLEYKAHKWKPYKVEFGNLFISYRLIHHLSSLYNINTMYMNHYTINKVCQFWHGWSETRLKIKPNHKEIHSLRLSNSIKILEPNKTKPQRNPQSRTVQFHQGWEQGWGQIRPEIHSPRPCIGLATNIDQYLIALVTG